MPLCLESAKNRQIIPLDKAVLLFGRHPDCDVVISQSAKISRKHCCIMHVNASCVLRDLGSTNGVHLNGQRVKKLAVLKNGDQLAIGDVMFNVNTYTKPQPSPKTPPVPERDTPLPNHTGVKSPAGSENFPEISIPEFDARSPLNISKELPVAISDDGEEFRAVPQSDPAFHEVADHGFSLVEDDDSGLEAADDSQVDVILLDPSDEDDD